MNSAKSRGNNDGFLVGIIKGERSKCGVGTTRELDDDFVDTSAGY